MKNKLQSLQFLRGLAALLVVIAHAIDQSKNFGASKIVSFYYFENFGAIGVDIFFVISGAIITIISKSNSLTPKLFFLKRCIRILPLYWAFSFFALLLGLLGFLDKVTLPEIFATLTVIPISINGYYKGPVMAIGWTLSFEFFFYIVFAIGLFFNRNKPQQIVFVALTFFVVVGLLFSSVKQPHFIFYTNAIILEFLFGCICGYIYLSSFKINNWVWYALVIISIIIFGLNIYYGFGNVSESKYTWNGTFSILRVIKWGIASFCLVTGLLMLDKNNKFKVGKLFIILGNVSYSVYITHYFSIVLAVVIYKRVGSTNADVFITVSSIFAFAVAYFVYILFEKPVTDYLNKKLVNQH